jgi:hypothetical protein
LISVPVPSPRSRSNHCLGSAADLTKEVRPFGV